MPVLYTVNVYERYQSCQNTFGCVLFTSNPNPKAKTFVIKKKNKQKNICELASHLIPTVSGTEAHIHTCPYNVLCIGKH